GAIIRRNGGEDVMDRPHGAPLSFPTSVHCKRSRTGHHPIDRTCIGLTSFRAICGIASIGTSCSDRVCAGLFFIKLSRWAHSAFAGWRFGRGSLRCVQLPTTWQEETRRRAEVHSLGMTLAMDVEANLPS